MAWHGDLRARIIYSRSPPGGGRRRSLPHRRKDRGLSAALRPFRILVRVTLGRSRAATRSIGAHGQGFQRARSISGGELLDEPLFDRLNRLYLVHNAEAVLSGNHSSSGEEQVAHDAKERPSVHFRQAKMALSMF